jgi:hypothetical protein
LHFCKNKGEKLKWLAAWYVQENKKCEAGWEIASAKRKPTKQTYS